jgi:hypothetical protein
MVRSPSAPQANFFCERSFPNAVARQKDFPQKNPASFHRNKTREQVFNTGTPLASTFQLPTDDFQLPSKCNHDQN